MVIFKFNIYKTFFELWTKMPFFGQDPRGPGFCWYKSDTSNSWKVLERNDVLMDTIPR